MGLCLYENLPLFLPFPLTPPPNKYFSSGGIVHPSRLKMDLSNRLTNEQNDVWPPATHLSKLQLPSQVSASDSVQTFSHN